VHVVGKHGLQRADRPSDAECQTDGVVLPRLGVPFLLRAVPVLVDRIGIGRSERLLRPAFLPIGRLVLGSGEASQPGRRYAC
jgi:hypothetical protein